MEESRHLFTLIPKRAHVPNSLTDPEASVAYGWDFSSLVSFLNIHSPATRDAAAGKSVATLLLQHLSAS